MTESRFKQTTEFLAVGTALFVSLSTLGVYIYQAKVMKEQQHVSVWPYVEWTTGNVKDFHVTVKNKGVGPALIQKVDMTLDGKPVHTATELVSAVCGPDWSLQGLINSSLEGRVMAPGEEVSPITITDVTEGRAFEAQMRKHAFKLRITYCSIYGDCWSTDGQRVQRGPKVDLGLY
ncbi:MAG TPA: hypothetical protein VJ570_03635 [Holophagaceae bacterium]|nr:hypothetical protein [Holophagaceae bacterium]